MAETFTADLELSKFGQGERFPVVSAAKLNANWDLIDDAQVGRGDEFPETFGEEKLFVRTDEGVIYQNTGTDDEPVWTAVLDVATLATAVAGKAPQSQVDTIQGDLDDLEAAVAALEAADYLKRDGSDPMTGDLDLGSHKLKGLTNGVASDEGVNRGQLDAVQASLISSLGSVRAVRVWRSTNDVHGAGAGTITLSWDTVKADVPAASGQVDLVNFPTHVFKCLRAGYYNFKGLFIAGGTSGNQLLVSVRKNGTTELCATIGINSGGSNPVMSAVVNDGPFLLAVNDYLEIRATTLNSNGSITIATGTGTDYGPFFSVEEVVDTAAGGGDLKSNGTVPMTADFDNGGFKQTNMDDGVAADDGATVGQMETADALLQDQIDAITDGTALGGDQRRYDGGNQGFSTLDWEGVTGETPMTFTLASPRFVSIDANGTALMDFQNRANLQLGIRLTKTGDAAIDIPGTMCYDPLGYYVNGSMVAAEKRTLSAGEWTIALIAKKVSNFPNNPILSKTASLPAYLGYVLTG